MVETLESGSAEELARALPIARALRLGEELVASAEQRLLALQLAAATERLEKALATQLHLFILGQWKIRSGKEYY